MKKLIFISLLLLISAIAFSQVGNTDQNLQNGKKAFKSKKYQDALVYLTMSIGENPTAPAYYYRSLTYNNIGDSCNSCKDLKKAASFNDVESGKIFEQKCTITTITNNIPAPIKLKYPEVSKLKIVHFKCDSDSLTFGIIGQEPKTNEIEIKTSENKSKNDDNNEIYTIVESMPSFPGGEKARNRFLAEHIKYPDNAVKYGIQGTCYVQFIIDSDGFVTEVKIIRGIGGGCDEEAVRVVKMMPQWNPGKQNGKTVRVLFNMPIYFGLGK